MGKRSKVSSTPREATINKKKKMTKVDSSEVDIEPKLKTKKSKITKDDVCEKSIESIDDIADSEVDTSIIRRKITRSFNKQDEAHEEVTKNIVETVSINKNKENKKKSKKTIFEEDDPVESSANSTNLDTSFKKTKKNKQPAQVDEEVKDEDIDNFCDELTEEDNVQFDNWVKLIEAKLHAKK